MLNREPIFIHGFARGGSNIIMNLLLSHPNVCLSNGETDKVFKGTKWDSTWDVAKKKLLFDYPICLLSRQNLFSQANLKKRKHVPDYLKRYIDLILYRGRYAAIVDTHNRYKSENIEYTKEELTDCRLLSKGLGGIAFTVDMFSEIYSDATFLGLVRNGFALCESFVRRGFDPKYVGFMYKTVARQLIKSAAERTNYHLYYYEDMVENPIEFMKIIYSATRLDINDITKVRLQSKGIMQSDGKRAHIKGRDREVFWHEMVDLHKFIKNDVNQNQIRQLKQKDRDKFLSEAGDVMEELGYTTKN
jgi:hypothetical protein